MKLSELLSQKMINRKAKLTVDIDLDDGEERFAGDIVSIMFEDSECRFHAEDNEWACKVMRDEFEYI